jgi:MFS superfamily sulfate permease-like transporter
MKPFETISGVILAGIALMGDSAFDRVPNAILYCILAVALTVLISWSLRRNR